MSPFLVMYSYKLTFLVLITNDVYMEEYCPSAFKTLVKNHIKRIKDIIKLCKAVITAIMFN